jgi:hypothetical protein
MSLTSSPRSMVLTESSNICRQYGQATARMSAPVAAAWATRMSDSRSPWRPGP